jgi:NitT/TauT family transport system permease protein
MSALTAPGAASAALIAILLALWQATFMLAGADAIASPASTVAWLAGHLTGPDLWVHVWATGSAFLLALAIAVLGGLAIGLLAGLSATATEAAEPLLLAANSIPKIALYPVVLLLFGIGMPAKVAFGAMHGVIPVAIFTMTACRAIPPVLLKTAAVMRLPLRHRVLSILLPSALPDIVSGVRLGFSLTLIGTILGEMFGSQSGLGYLLMIAIGLQNTQAIMGVTVLLIVFAASASTALLAWERRLRRARGAVGRRPFLDSNRTAATASADRSRRSDQSSGSRTPRP